MFRTLLHTMVRGGLKGKSWVAHQRRRYRCTINSAVEALENRIVLSFSAASSISVGTAPDIFIPNAAPESVASADLNGATLNGKPILDLIEVHNFDANNGYVDVLMGNGDGTFKSAVKYPTTAYLDGDVLLGDFTNDGKISLILPYLNSSLTEAGYVEMLGNGDGTFQAPIYSATNVFNPFGSNTYARGWAVGDFNGASKNGLPILDLVANDVGVGVTVLLGNGDGTFQAPITTNVSMGYSRWIAVGDFNGNGLDDLAIADGTGANNQESPGAGAGGSELTILMSNGNGTFGPAVHYAAPPTPDSGSDGLGGGDILNPEDVTVAALVPGGPLDVIESLYDHSIDVFMGNGDGTFQSAVGYTTGEYPRDVQVADLTGNGIPDLIVDNVGVGPGGAASFAEGFEDGSIAVLMGNGDGTFQAPIQYNSVYYPGYVAVGDFNNDGLPDLAVTGVSNQSTVNTLLNEPASDPVTLASPASAAGVLPDQPASVFANSPSGITTVLSALGADSTTAENNLTYTWSVLSKPSGAGNPTFSLNGSNAAQNTTATLSGFGLYTFEVTITDPLGSSITSSVQVFAVQNTAPTVGSAPIVVSPSPVTGTRTTLEIPLGSNIGGAESDNGYVNLTYTWATVGTPPAPITFTQVGPPLTETGIVYPVGNSLSADYETTAKFAQAGTYTLQVTLTDPEGDSVSSSPVTVTVNQTLTSIVMTPGAVNVADGGTQQFNATALDQFGNPMATQPSLTWTTTGPGSVNSSGLYSAPAIGTGSATVKATVGSVSGTAAVAVTAGQPPVLTAPASAAPSPVAGSNTTLSVSATDPQGQALTYTWATTGTPPAPVSFSANGSAAASSTTATFSKAGSYTFQVTITDTSGLSTTSNVTVTVNQTWTGIGVIPANSMVEEGGTQQFSASALDQFGVALANQPAFTWSVNGVGSVSSSGLYTAPANMGSATVTATSSSFSGSASVTVTAGQVPPTITGIAANIGPTNGGESVVLTGTNFSGATAVDFGNVVAPAFTVNSATQITVTTPAGSVGTVDITVTTAGGTSATSGADQFTYQAPYLDTWTGLGATNNWSDAGNWSKDAAPGPGDTAVFDGHSGKNATVDSGFAGNVAALQINSGYTGTISLSRNLTVTATFTQQAGTYNDGNFATDVSGLSTLSGGSFQASTTADVFTGGLTVSGGTFAGSTGTVTTGNVTLSSGTLDAPSGTLDITGGNFSYTGGLFNAEGGTVSYTGSGTPTVTGSKFYNFQDSLAPYPSTLTISGTVTTAGTFSILGSSLIVNGNIEAQGNVDDENHGGIGNPILTLDGNANQTIEDMSGVGGGQFRTITINKTGGTVSLACNPIVFTGLTLTAGIVNTGNHAWFLSSSSPVSTAPGTNLGNIEVNGSVTVGSASLQVANVTFAAAGDSLKAPTANLFVSGNWNDSVGGTFTPNGGTVIFDGSGAPQQLTSGGKPFNNLTIASGASVILEGNLNYTGTFTNDGTFNPNGQTVNGHAASQPPVVTAPASAAPSPVAGSNTTLSVSATDPQGQALTYTWATTGAPPAPVSFSANGSAAASSTTATFSKAGSYTFQVTITDTSGLSTTSNVTVTVNQNLTTIVVAPGTAIVTNASSQSFSATGYDQFGALLPTPPAFTWSVNGLGSINGSGLYTTPASGSGPATVTAASGSVRGSSAVTVIASAAETWTGLGLTNNWSEAANWSADAVPGTGTSVIFNGTSNKNAVVDGGFAGIVAAVQINSGYAGTVSLNETLTDTGGFSQAAGTFSAGASTLLVAGNCMISGGTFNAGTGTVDFDQSGGTGTTVTVSAVGVTFNNVTVAQGNPSGSNTNQLMIGGSTATLTVNGTFTYAGGIDTFITGGTVDLAGNLDDQKSGWTGSPIFVLAGGGNQTILDSHPVGTGPGNEGLARNIIINKAGGTLFLTTDLTVYGNLTLQAGTVSTSSGSWILSGPANMTLTDSSGGSLGNIQIYASRILSGTSLQVGSVTFASGGSLTAPTGTLYVSGNWNNSASDAFMPNGGSVDFDGSSGTQQLTSGGQAFNNLIISAGSGVVLEDNLTIDDVFTNFGTLNLNGHTVTMN